MSAEGGARRTVRQWVWPVATVVLGYFAATRWLHPLAHARGRYAGYYRITDIQWAAGLTLVWIAVFAVTLCPPAKRRPLALRLATAIGAVLLTLGLCDLTYTLWSIRFGHVLCGRHAFAKMTTQSDPELIFKHKPGISWRGRKTPDCQLIDFRTDENGFRNPPGIRQADVVFIGDSVTEAGEVAEDVTFVRRAGGDLGLSAVNLGVFCYGPQQELAVLRRYGLGYRPRVVVWQVTEWNDLDDAEHYLQGQTDGWKIMTWSELYENHSPLVKAIAKLFPPRPRNVVAFVRSDGRVDQRLIWPFINPVPACPTGLTATLGILKEAHALCRERGITFVVLMVPAHGRVLAPYVKPRSVEEALRYRPPSGLDPPNDLGHVLTAFCRTEGCAFVDVTADLRRLAARDNRNVYVKNDTHLGAAAHEDVARTLRRCLEPVAAVAHGETSTKLD